MSAPAPGWCKTGVPGLRPDPAGGPLLWDVVLSRDEVDGLMVGLLASDAVPTGTTSLSSWLNDNVDPLSAGLFRSQSAIAGVYRLPQTGYGVKISLWNASAFMLHLFR